jgi:phage terminase large subunit-like protein
VAAGLGHDGIGRILEDGLFSTAGYAGARSPDHADAATWGLTELMLDAEPVPGVRFFSVH